MPTEDLAAAVAGSDFEAFYNQRIEVSAAP
jgi:hypothetical protein